MRNAGCKQTDGRELVVLNKLVFEPDSVRDVIDNDQLPTLRACLVLQRSGGEIDDQTVPRLLVEVAGFRQTLQKLCRNNLFRPPAISFAMPPSGQLFQRSVPANDSSIDILYDNAHVNGFDNVLAEILEALI